MILRSRAYLDYVKSHVSCLRWDGVDKPVRHHMVDPQPFTVAHYVRLRNNMGVGPKPSDYLTVPLTDLEHRELHKIGEAKFWEARGVDPDNVILSLLGGWLAVDLPGGEDRRAILKAVLGSLT